MFPTDPAEPQKRIPRTVRDGLVACLERAYEEALEIREDHPMLGKYGHGSMTHGNLVYWLANNNIHEAVTLGTLPGKANFKPAEHGGAEYLEYWFGGVTITLARVEASKKSPRKSIFRQNKAFGNQSLLGFMDTPPRDVEAALVLIHGHKRLSFAHLVLPGLEGDKITVLHRSENLLGNLNVMPIENIEAAIEVDEFGLSLREEFLIDNPTKYERA